VIELTDDKELEDIEKALKAIGGFRVPEGDALIREVRSVLVEKGYDEAIVYAEQRYQAADLNAGLVRALMICRRFGLSPQAAALVLDNLG
jgi:hypothetical protein